MNQQPHHPLYSLGQLSDVWPITPALPSGLQMEPSEVQRAPSPWVQAGMVKKTLQQDSVPRSTARGTRLATDSVPALARVARVGPGLALGPALGPTMTILSPAFTLCHFKLGPVTLAPV